MATISVQRPQRWDHPFDPNITPADVDRLLAMHPFNQMDPSRFSEAASLADILRHDCRLRRLQRGDVVFREGQYGSSAFLVLGGEVAAAILEPPVDQRGERPTVVELLRRVFNRLTGQKRPAQERRRTRRPESTTAQSADPRNDASNARFIYDTTTGLRFGTRSSGPSKQSQLFLQDIPGVLQRGGVSTIHPGELFGELAAVTRSPRDFTAIATKDDTLLLEIRWQGLKLLQQDPAFRQALNERYRQSTLALHLRETDLFRFVPDSDLEQIVASAQLLSFGQLEWYARYRRQSQQPPNERIESEPLIALEGQYATGIWIVRSGFARVSWRQGTGHRTLAYLGKGGIFGLPEIVHNCIHFPDSAPLPLQQSLRAIGYVDIIWIPKQVVTEHVLPFVRRQTLPPPITRPRYQFNQPLIDAPLADHTSEVDSGLLEFLVDHRLNNGQRTMIVDLHRCTRCDDCVRACAATHGGQPVFERTGPIYQRWMFPHACMHCEDPVCMIGCPTGAIHRDGQTGLVDINTSTCIGCKICAESCPYDNIRMVPVQDELGRVQVDQQDGLPLLVASKCDFCTQRGSQPACYQACPHDALVRIDTSDMESLAKWWRGRAA